MGLFDWMSGNGDVFGSNQPFINASNSYGGPGGQPEIMQPPAPAPQMPPPPAAAPQMPPDPAADGLSLPPGMGPPPPVAGLPPGIPMPQPRPPGADAALPPNATSTAGVGGPPGLPPASGPMTPAEGQGIVRSYEGAGGHAFAPPSGPQAQSILGRALGLDPNRDAQIRGGLAEGLKAAGNSSGKSPFQAITGAAGATLEGGKKADDKTTEQQDKYLQRAIAAKKEGNNAEYQKNYLRYQIAATKAKLEASKEKAAGKDSVMNSPEQLYLRGVGATNADGELKILANKAREAEKIGDAKASKEAMDAYNKRRQEVLDGHLGRLGIDPAKVKGIAEKPGFSEKNPVKEFPKDPAAAQKAFDALPEGAYFINPKDGRLLTKKSAGGAGQPNPAQNQAALAPPMPPMPMDPNLNSEAA